MVILVALGGFLVTCLSYVLGVFSLLFNLPDVVQTIWNFISSAFGA